MNPKACARLSKAKTTIMIMKANSFKAEVSMKVRTNACPLTEAAEANRLCISQEVPIANN